LLLAGCSTVGPAPAPEAPQPAAAPAVAEPPAKAPPAEISTTPAPAKPVPPTPAPAKPAPTKPAPAPAPLDLKSLEQRLRDTPAIGVFTKLALKNQVDDLLEQFRTHYHGRQPPAVTELRQPYERLLLKVLSLLQDADPALARDIVASREAIWSILSDRNKFNSLI
jgi:hypothetical protein